MEGWNLLFVIWFICSGNIVINTAAISASGTYIPSSPANDSNDIFKAAPPRMVYFHLSWNRVCLLLIRCDYDVNYIGLRGIERHSWSWGNGYRQNRETGGDDGKRGGNGVGRVGCGSTPNLTHTQDGQRSYNMPTTKEVGFLELCLSEGSVKLFESNRTWKGGGWENNIGDRI